jgi:hypothetical protein
MNPFVPSPFTYGDSPQGSSIAPITVAARAPSNTIDKSYVAGTFWLASLDQSTLVNGVPTYGSGNLYYQAGSTSGTPNWVLISDSSGSIVGINGTTNQITVTTAAGVATLSIPTTFTAPGAITATLGNITATNGNLVLSTAGNKLVINAATPTTSSVGTTEAMVAGAVTITSSAITAASKIIYSRRTLGTAMGNVSITAQAGGSATLTSDEATETSTFDYLIIN